MNICCFFVCIVLLYLESFVSLYFICSAYCCCSSSPRRSSIWWPTLLLAKTFRVIHYLKTAAVTMCKWETKKKKILQIRLCSQIKEREIIKMLRSSLKEVGELKKKLFSGISFKTEMYYFQICNKVNPHKVKF